MATAKKWADEAVHCLRQGEQSRCIWLLRCGNASYRFVCVRVNEGASRQQATHELESKLREIGETHDVNDLIRAYWTARLLDSLGTHLPYRIFRLCSCAVERSLDGSFVLVNGREKEIKSAWKKIVDDGLTGDEAYALMKHTVVKKGNKTFTSKPHKKVVSEEQEMLAVDERVRKNEMLLLALAEADPKDVADTIMEIIENHDRKTDVAQEVMRRLVEQRLVTVKG